ncbi:Uncharacterised protein [Mycobacteroides abscessus]|nr:Uncharacterised protein [Mycobacteroides abscessus]
MITVLKLKKKSLSKKKIYLFTSTMKLKIQMLSNVLQLLLLWDMLTMVKQRY